MAATASLPPKPTHARLERRVAAIDFRGPGARFLAVELLVWSSLYGLYLIVRGVSLAGGDEALSNARALVDLEEALGLFQERHLQEAARGVDALLTAYYLLGFAPLLAVVLGWMAVRHRDLYRRLRLVLFLSIAVAVVVHVALPVAPPRLVPELGISDTVGLERDGSSFAGIPYNPYAAMPSMHVGWSFLVALFAARVSGSIAARAFFVAHPVLMVVAVTATGNHYFLDSLAGVVVALGAFAAWRLAPLTRQRLAARPEPACAYC